jgi:hypothetical protein
MAGGSSTPWGRSATTTATRIPPPAGAEIPSRLNAPARSARTAASLVSPPHGSPGRSGRPADADRSPDPSPAESRRPWRRPFLRRPTSTRPNDPHPPPTPGSVPRPAGPIQISYVCYNLPRLALTTEWHRWLSPIQSLFPSLALPASTGFNGNPFLLDPESVPRVVMLSFRSFERG